MNIKFKYIPPVEPKLEKVVIELNQDEVLRLINVLREAKDLYDLYDKLEDGLKY